LDALFDPSELSPKAGQFGLAWVLTKLTEPVRLFAAVALTPRIARLLGRVPKDEKFADSLAAGSGLLCSPTRLYWDDLVNPKAKSDKDKDKDKTASKEPAKNA